MYNLGYIYIYIYIVLLLYVYTHTGFTFWGGFSKLSKPLCHYVESKEKKLLYKITYFM